jgi:CHAT domain-containing protein
MPRSINPVDLTKPQELKLQQPSSQDYDLDSLAIDNLFSSDYTKRLGLEQTQQITLAEARNILRQAENATGIKPALIYAVFVPSTITPVPTSASNTGVAEKDIESSLLRSSVPSPSDRLELILITADAKPIRRSVDTTRAEVLAMAREFRGTSTNLANNSGFRTPAQKMYQWLVAPLEPELQQQNIKNLTYLMDAGLRSIPLAALHDGKGFIVERYSVGLMPSLSLTDTRYVDVRSTQILAMGADKFTDQIPLPAVSVELSTLTGQLWQGQSYINDGFTLANLQSMRSQKPFGILHLATHAEYQPDDPNNSYIQLWDSKLRLNQLRLLGLHKPPVELLVLSACRTAVGDAKNELGFAGLAAQAGAKSVLGSLWYVDDQGTLALMIEFYEQLKKTPFKAEALRKTQLAMLKGEVRSQGGKLVTSQGNFPLPPHLANRGNINLTHPYYWSAFTMIGRPW